MYQLSSLSRILRLLALLSLGGLMAACSGEVLDPGDIARQQRDLIYFHRLMLLIIVPVLMLSCCFQAVPKGGHGTYDSAVRHSTGLELAIWSAPLPSHRARRPDVVQHAPLDPFGRAGERRHEAAVVQVVSLDLKWLFIYPEEEIATINELVLPVDRPVRFDITSSNMMNTFYAPTLAGMIYAMPGMPEPAARSA